MKRAGLPRRFYKQAGFKIEGDGVLVTLDGRPVRTPAKAALQLPTTALAQAIVAEWNAQDERIDPFSMPLTKLANTAIDRVAPDQARIGREIAQMAEHDLVCYRAEGPADLRDLEALHWDPVLAWAMTALDAQFEVTTGIQHVEQPAKALAAIRRHLDRQSAWQLTALHNMATLTGSSLVAAMCAAGALSPAEAWTAAHVDEDWQIAQWGADEEARARRSQRQAEFLTCRQFLELLAARV